MDDDRPHDAPGTDAVHVAEDEPSGSPSDDPAPGARDVVVPLPVYKIVTVFSTLIAVVFVVGGFLALDAATRRATAPPAEIDPLLTALGLFAIVAGGGIYAFASRFRAPGMGTPKPDDDEPENDG